MSLHNELEFNFLTGVITTQQVQKFCFLVSHSLFLWLDFCSPPPDCFTLGRSKNRVKRERVLGWKTDSTVALGAVVKAGSKTFLFSWTTCFAPELWYC